jgi:hypothetical protein
MCCWIALVFSCLFASIETDTNSDVFATLDQKYITGCLNVTAATSTNNSDPLEQVFDGMYKESKEEVLRLHGMIHTYLDISSFKHYTYDPVEVLHFHQHRYVNNIRLETR